MTQPSIFDTPPVMRSRAPREARARLNRQSEAILARLRQGSISNRELAEFGLNTRARISEIRAAGYVVECYDRDAATGLSRYRLTP